MLTELYCKIDDFGKLLQEKLKMKTLIGTGKSRNKCKMSMSEIATITVFYQYSGYKTFKDYYQKEVLLNLKKEFPNAVSYSRMVELKQESIWFLTILQKAFSRDCTGISIIDSTSLEVCHPRRIYRHKTFKNIAKRGKTSVKWFFGFKLHVVINHFGDIISFYITPGNVADNNKDVVEKVTEDCFGKLVADKGYIGRFKDLFNRGITLIHGVRSTMKNKLFNLFDKFLLKKRGIVESVFGILKSTFDLEHSKTS